jgi:hypothetical protein
MSILDRYESLPWADYLITSDGRCVRHPDEPVSWCLECRAIARGDATRVVEEDERS